MEPHRPPSVRRKRPLALAGTAFFATSLLLKHHRAARITPETAIDSQKRKLQAPEWCPGILDQQAVTIPLQGSCSKAAALDRFWSRDGAIAYWHVQRTGGAALCAAAFRAGMYTDAFLDGYTMTPPRGGRAEALKQLEWDSCQFGYLNESECNRHGFFGDRIYKPCRLHAATPPTWEAQVPMGRYFFAMQPERQDDWPFQWYYNSFFRDQNHPFWTRWVHVITIRNPVERFLSEFNKRQFLENCRFASLTFAACIDRMITAPDRLEQLFQAHGMNGFVLGYHIKYRLMANQLVMHLTGREDATVADAKAALDRMSLVLDFRARPEESVFLLRKLFRDESIRVEQIPRLKQPLPAPARERFPEQYEQVRRHLTDDFEVYEHAVRLLEDHARRLGFVAAAGLR